MKVIIAIEGGRVSEVYANGGRKIKVQVLDVDNIKEGGPVPRGYRYPILMLHAGKARRNELRRKYMGASRAACGNFSTFVEKVIDKELEKITQEEDH